MHHNAALWHVRAAAAWLPPDPGASTAGGIVFADGGDHVTGMARPETR